MPKRKKPLSVPRGFLIELDIWKCGVVVTWEPNFQKIVEFAKSGGVRITRGWIENAMNARSGAAGTCGTLGTGNTDILVQLKRRPRRASQYNTLYHELHHAVYLIANQHNFSDEIEAQAYTFEYLVSECNRRLWPKK